MWPQYCNSRKFPDDINFHSEKPRPIIPMSSSAEGRGQGCEGLQELEPDSWRDPRSGAHEQNYLGKIANVSVPLFPCMENGDTVNST